MVHFTNILNVSTNILAKNKNFQKLRHDFVDERAIIATTISSCHWKTLEPFCLQKKRTENTNSELLQNRTEKLIMTFKSIVN